MSSVFCTSCGKDRNSVSGRPSALLKGGMNLLCETCSNAGYEPRHLIIIVGRSKGVDFVRPWILSHKYVGDPITAIELTT